MDKKFKLAIINQNASTGGWKVLYLLLKSLKNSKTLVDITCFIKYYNMENSAIDTLIIDKLKSIGVKIEILKDPVILESREFIEKKISGIKFIDKICNRKRALNYNEINAKIASLNQNLFESNENELVEKLNSNDAILYFWPYQIQPFKSKRPIFYITHDFIFSHFFGFHSGHAYTREWWQQQVSELSTFIKQGSAIASTPFIAKELKRIYPDYKKNINIVYWSKLNEYEDKGKGKNDEVIEKYDLPEAYILYANNRAMHKNMQEVLGGYFYVKQKYPNLKLIITGWGTEGIYCQANTPHYLDHVDYKQEYDVKSLGLIPEDDFLEIMKSAKMVINSSLCEAGPGSASDAWAIGTPVVLSDIEPFRQHTEFIGAKAEFFDPKNSQDIANAIIKLLDNPQLAKEYVKISKEAMRKYTWDDVAEQYLKIFMGGGNER